MNQAEIGHDDVGENSNDGQVATSATSNINDIRNQLYVLPTTTGSGKIVDGERLEDGLGAGRNRQQARAYDWSDLYACSVQHATIMNSPVQWQIRYGASLVELTQEFVGKFSFNPPTPAQLVSNRYECATQAQ